MGDLNFRLDDIPKVDIEEKVQKGELKSLWPHDQVNYLSHLQTVVSLNLCCCSCACFKSISIISDTLIML